MTFGGKKNLLPVPGFEPKNIQPVRGSYNDHDVPNFNLITPLFTKMKWQ
jgi:hypothetical protein